MYGAILSLHETRFSFSDCLESIKEFKFDPEWLNSLPLALIVSSMSTSWLNRDHEQADELAEQEHEQAEQEQEPEHDQADEQAADAVSK